MQNTIYITLFFIILTGTAWFWDYWNRKVIGATRQCEEVFLRDCIDNAVVLYEELYKEGQLQLAGVVEDCNSDVPVEMAIQAIEVYEDLEIVV